MLSATERAERSPDLVVRSSGSGGPELIRVLGDWSAMSASSEQTGRSELRLAMSDQSQLRYLRELLRSAPGVEVVNIAGTPGAGEQGAWDVLQLLAASGGALVMAIKILPDFLRARRSNVTITIEFETEKYMLNATNVDDVIPALERMLDGRRAQH